MITEELGSWDKSTIVGSSNIRSVAYNDKRRILEVTFHHGSSYQYSGVPRSAYEALLVADSAGKYFAEHIKHKYIYGKVG